YITGANEEKISSGNSYLPIKIISKKFYKTKKTTYTLSEERAKKRAEKTANKKIAELLGKGELIDKKQKIVCDENTLIIKTNIKCVKDIVFEENLLLDTSN
ncbi:MAG: sporulation protein YqfD, partial [Acutalibacteraceae bacterium]|nr:sporulation protein YqfD [Acutalibacteraceae bacterium]